MEPDWNKIAFDLVTKRVESCYMVKNSGVCWDNSLKTLSVMFTYNTHFSEDMVNEVKEKLLEIKGLKYVSPWYASVLNDGLVEIQLKFEINSSVTKGE